MQILSDKQSKVLQFIKTFIADNDYPPSVRDVAEGCGIKFASVAQYYLNVLEKKGHINRSRSVSRGIALQAKRVEVNVVPLLGSIAAGTPIPTPHDDTWSTVPEDSIALPENLLIGHANVFALRVKGTSMIDALIDNGDIVLLTQTNSVEDGSMVAVWLKDKNEVTLKRIFHKNGQICLQPANKLMQPMYCQPENVEVQGKVIGIIRKID